MQKREEISTKSLCSVENYVKLSFYKVFYSLFLQQQLQLRKTTPLDNLLGRFKDGIYGERKKVLWNLCSCPCF